MRNTQYIPAYLVSLLVVICLLQACNGCNTNKTPASPAADTTTTQIPTPNANDTLRNWAEQRLIQWKGWIDSSMMGRSATDSLVRTNVDTIAALDTITMEADRFEEYKPFFVYSPDSTQVVDMVSYNTIIHKGRDGKIALEGGDPDMEVALVNVQTKKRERILFVGTTTMIIEAVWINNHTILIAGGIYDEHDQLHPVIWKYDTEQRLLENWENEDL
ncbi:hypothetical protein F0L74_03270 [Chitinophaga agrisoli]|uniref:Uncharacterized protein n=1 Tax=Chitinophaga agrisoli TaxID=2607653 RepID=A0A5B2W3B1_9BACT|nr:hypothetical protein [Chitinophaga agrisoli]KAA2244996.1 hypothetical protein F0L74_03270 [Chitinophaga agrisoli]